MALDFGSVNTKGSNNSAKAGLNEQRPSSQVWVNVGYETTFTNEEGKDETRFISLPVNLGVDTMDPLKVNSQNQLYNDQQSARNDLLAQILEKAKELSPGEGTLINLQVQLFRANEKVEPTKSENNRFAFKQTL